MANCLITGGAGFIGSHIAHRLVSEGHSVRVVDNLSTGKRENLEEIEDKIQFIYGDLTDFKTAVKAVDGMEYVFHHAALPSVALSVEDPIAVNRSIVDTTINLFKASVDAKTVKRIVQAASAAAYGNDPVLPKKEDMFPYPESPYAVAKLTQEYYGKAFYQVYGLEVQTLRYFNVFGPKQDPKSFYSGVISIFSDLMAAGKVPVIHGDGLTSRDFIYIDDIVEANLLAATCKWPGSSEIINIGRGERTTLNELVEMLNRVLGTSIIPMHDEPRIGDLQHSVADISKAQNLLGFQSRISVYDGLCRLLNRRSV